MGLAISEELWLQPKSTTGTYTRVEEFILSNFQTYTEVIQEGSLQRRAKEPEDKVADDMKTIRLK